MFSKDLELTIGQCYKEAREQRHEFMTVEHLLLALLENPSATAVLRACGADLDKLGRDLRSILNDDFTPMDFVIVVLETFFSMNRERATQVMLHVHTRGKGVCGLYTREVAETKVTQVNEFSRTHQHPLLCTMEKT